MIDSILKALQGIVKKPLLLAPALVLPLLMLGLILLFQEPLFNLLVETLFLENLPETTLSAFPLHLVAMYPLELGVVALMAFIMGIASISITFFYSKAASGLAGGKCSIAEACSATTGSIKDIVMLAIFFAVIALFIVVLAWLFFILAGINALSGLVLLVLLGLLLAYVVVKLSFTVQAMAIENLRAKEAMAKSWAFTNKRFWSVLLFLVVVAAVYSIIINIGGFIDSLVPEETIGSVIFTVFWMAGITYSNMAIAFYYLKKEFKK